MYHIMLGKHWHIEHFACAKCEKPFLGNRHYERKGLAYCAAHYHQVISVKNKINSQSLEVGYTWHQTASAQCTSFSCLRQLRFRAYINFFFSVGAMSATLSTSMSATMCTSMSATTMSSRRIVRAQRR